MCWRPADVHSPHQERSPSSQSRSEMRAYKIHPAYQNDGYADSTYGGSDNGGTDATQDSGRDDATPVRNARPTSAGFHAAPTSTYAAQSSSAGFDWETESSENMAASPTVPCRSARHRHRRRAIRRYARKLALIEVVLTRTESLAQQTTLGTAAARSGRDG